MTMEPGPFRDIENFDTDHDGQSDMTGYSLPMNDHALVNAVSVYGGDANMDFQIDTLVADTDGDHRPDTYIKDFDGDGMLETTELDPDQDGRINARVIDTDADGRPDVVQLIDERTGQVTHQAIDANGDGVEDGREGQPGATARVAFGVAQDGNLWQLVHADVPVPVTPVAAPVQTGAGDVAGPLDSAPQDPAPQPAKSLLDLYEEVMSRPIDTSDPVAVAQRQELLDGLQRLIQKQQEMAGDFLN